jgi:hypothetical protein
VAESRYAALLRGPIMKVSGMGPLCVRCGADAVAVVSVRQVLQDRAANWPVCADVGCHAGAMFESAQALRAISAASAPAQIHGEASVSLSEPSNGGPGGIGAGELQRATEGPHSRACGLREHQHGVACNPNCPTCHGRPVTGGAVIDATVADEPA